MRALLKMGLTALSVLLLLLAMSAAEAQRPMFHVRPPANWINDPNGPYRDPITGKMHLYMQYNPFDAVWGEMHWYHFTSEDYVTWRDEGIALKNNQWYDHWGAYSGSITHNPEDGTPVLMYTCVSDLDVQRQCIAVPHSKDIRGPNAPRTLNTFFKPENNPVLTEKDVPGLVGLGNFRDPTNFWKNPDNASEWLVAFVARIKGEKVDDDHGHVVVFKTADKTWRSGFTYSHSLWHEENDSYHMLECPDFFQLGGLHYMKVSTMISRQDVWVYGSYKKADPKGNTVYVEDKDRTPTYIDYGRWYASKQNFDPILNRTILWGWIVEEIDENEVMRAQGWSGMMDMPRNVEYDEKAKKLKTYPMPELQELRMEPLVKGKEFKMEKGKPAKVSEASGRHYELVVDFELPEKAMVDGEYEPGKEPSFGVDVMGSADGKTYTRIAVTMPSTVAPGNELTGRAYSTLTVDTEEECKAACERERRCVAWTSAQEKEKKFTCTLRSTVGEVKKAEAATSGRVKDPVLLLDRTKSTTSGFTDTWAGRAPLLNGLKAQLRIFVDGTAVQVFKDGGRESLSARVYLSDKELTHVSLFASNIEGVVTATATLYPMKGVYAAGRLDTVDQEGEEGPVTRDASGDPVRCVAALLLALLALAQMAL